jgi:hypothetical protein
MNSRGGLSSKHCEAEGGDVLAAAGWFQLAVYGQLAAGGGRCTGVSAACRHTHQVSSAFALLAIERCVMYSLTVTVKSALAGHSRGFRTLACPARAAPLCFSFLGFPRTFSHHYEVRRATPRLCVTLQL